MSTWITHDTTDRLQALKTQPGFYIGKLSPRFILFGTSSRNGCIDVICVEDLNVRGMTASAKGAGRSAKAGLNRGIMAHNFGEFRELLEYKADWYGKEVAVIDRFYPSSKRCSACGRINDDLKLGHRFWTCPCGAHHDRDINAAKNIKAAGLAVLASGD